LALIYRTLGARATDLDSASPLLVKMAAESLSEVDALIIDTMDKLDELSDIAVALAGFDPLRYEALLHAWPPGPARVALRLEFDEAGDIIGTWCDARPYLEGKTSVPRPWAGRFSDYAVVGGIRIPTRGEVRWELPDGPFTYWRGTITSIELDPS